MEEGIEWREGGGSEQWKDGGRKGAMEGGIGMEGGEEGNRRNRKNESKKEMRRVRE